MHQALRGEHVLDLRGPDAEGQTGERAVRAGVRVAAHDGHPRQRGALLGPDHMHDALAGVEKRKIGLGAVLAHVRVQRLHLGARDRVLDALVPVAGRRVVVGGGDDGVDAPGPPAGELQALEGLRAGDFVHQVPVDVDERRAVGFLAHDVARPEFVVERLRVHGGQILNRELWHSRCAARSLLPPTLTAEAQRRDSRRGLQRTGTAPGDLATGGVEDIVRCFRGRSTLSTAVSFAVLCVLCASAVQQ